MAKSQKLKVMVSSTVYGIEDLLEQIYGVLQGYGYEVWMSHKGTIPLANLTAFENCLKAVDSCDVFLGIITGRYGSGRERDSLSITHQEIRRAIEQNKLRFFAVHHNVVIARQLLKQFRYDKNDKPKPPGFYKPTAILDDIRVLDMYEEAMRSDLPLQARTGNWVQQYTSNIDLLNFIRTQLADPKRINDLLEQGLQRTPQPERNRRRGQ